MIFLDSLEIFFGISTIILIYWSPCLYLLTSLNPLFFNFIKALFFIPLGRGNFTFLPSKVGTSISAPKIASV